MEKKSFPVGELVGGLVDVDYEDENRQPQSDTLKAVGRFEADGKFRGALFDSDNSLLGNVALSPEECADFRPLGF